MLILYIGGSRIYYGKSVISKSWNIFTEKCIKVPIVELGGTVGFMLERYIIH